jgi:4-amino-4-deoxy-L-arabinose transferase-like glycosyltransferase
MSFGSARRLPQLTAAASMSTRTLLLVALGTAFVLRLAALVLKGDISQGANIWEYGEQGLCALANGGQLCTYYPSGNGTSYPSAYMPPLLSYLWLGLFHIFGDGSAARAVWLAANVAAALGCVALVFYLSLKLWPSRWAAFAAAMLVATYPTFVFVTATYHQTNWAVLLLLGITAVAVKLATGGSPLVYGALGGLLCGLGALNRTEMLVIGPVLIALGAVWRRRASDVVKIGVAGALAMVLILAPWTVRNYETFGRFVPTAQSMGYNLWKGFNPHTIGSGNQSEETNSPGWAELVSISESVPPGDDYEPRLQDRYMEAFTSDLESASPQRLLGLTANKVLLLWGYDWTDRETTGRPAYVLPWLVVNILVLVGLVTAWRRRRTLRSAPATIYLAALGLLTVAYAMTSVHARYRMHIEPYLFILAGIGIEAVWLRFRTMRTHPTVATPDPSQQFPQQAGTTAPTAER